MKRNLISAILIVVTIILAIIFYIVLFNSFEKVWFDFVPVFYFCLITFFAAIGIFVSAILIEKKQEN